MMVKGVQGVGFGVSGFGGGAVAGREMRVGA